MTGASSSLFGNLGALAAIGFLPFVLIAGTSFIKISVVLAILRSALGAQDVPPTAVLTALAAVLSLFVMAPVGLEIAAALEAAGSLARAASDPLGLAQLRALYAAASPPLLEFLRLNTPGSEVAFFADLAGDPFGKEPGIRVLLPAFASGELVEGLRMGVLIFIPFVVIDLIVANTLLALGLQMVSPAGIALPLKLLLFVAVDGWHVILNGLLVSYSA